MTINVCLAGATGWVGKCLSVAIHSNKNLQLVSAISRKYAGKNLGDVVGQTSLDLSISGTVTEALKKKCDVFVDYTKPDIVKTHVREAIAAGCHVVIGTSGLTDEDFRDIDKWAQEKKVGVLAAGNFAITVVLLQRFAEMAAKYVPHWEVFDYAYEGKPDAPSSTARDIVDRLNRVGKPIIHYPIEKTHGLKESRGATLHGTQVHSVRLPGFVFAVETIFGLSNERLSLKHEAGSSAEPYVNGTILAINKVSSFVGLKRGLDTIMDL